MARQPNPTAGKGRTDGGGAGRGTRRMEGGRPYEPPHPDDDPGDRDDPGAAESLRAEATETIRECESRWSDFRTTGGLALSKYFDRSFRYVESILQDQTSATDWVKDGVALLVGYYGATRDVYQALHKLYPSGRPSSSARPSSSTRPPSSSNRTE